MDDSTFDALTRSFALPSRRSVLSAIGTAIFTALLGSDAAEEALAKRKRQKRQRAKKKRRENDRHRVDADKKKDKKKKEKKKKKPPVATVPPAGDPLPPPPPPTCAQSCAGCCAGETCLAGTSATACGGGGSPCRVCTNPTPSCLGKTCAACTASSQCPSGSVCDGEQCQTCTVTCPGGECDGTVELQPALEAGETVYACPGRYIGSFNISADVTLIGAGGGADPAQNTILDAAAEPGQFNVMNIGPPGLTVELRGLRLTGGSYASSGGIDNWGGALAMTNCTVVDNTSGGEGGGINNNTGSKLTMTNCTISENSAGGDGAGIHNSGQDADLNRSTVTLNGCTVTGNTAANHGGGIFNGAGNTVTLNASSSASSSVTGNTANGEEPAGGGIFNEGTVTINDGTVSGNVPDQCIDSGTGDGCL